MYRTTDNITAEAVGGRAFGKRRSVWPVRGGLAFGRRNDRRWYQQHGNAMRWPLSLPVNGLGPPNNRQLAEPLPSQAQPAGHAPDRGSQYFDHLTLCLLHWQAFARGHPCAGLHERCPGLSRQKQPGPLKAIWLSGWRVAQSQPVCRLTAQVSPNHGLAGLPPWQQQTDRQAGRLDEGAPRLRVLSGYCCVRQAAGQPQARVDRCARRMVVSAFGHGSHLIHDGLTAEYVHTCMVMESPPAPAPHVGERGGVQEEQ